MRFPSPIGILILATLVPAAWGQSVPYDAMVIVPEVEARSGPSGKSYPTNKLRHNDRVRVHHDESGWLAIAPPAGSFSWINDRFIKRSGHNALVMGTDKAPLRIGSELLNAPPNREIPVASGTWLVVIGKELVTEEGVWWPVQPPPSEFRYVPREAVKAVSAPAIAVLPTPAPGPASSPATTTQPVKAETAAPLEGKQLLERAQQAERTGKYTEAEQLYTQLANQATEPGHRIWYQNRAQFLRDQARTSTFRPVNTTPSGPANVTLAPPSASDNALTAKTQVQPEGREYEGSGWLRRTTFQIGGKPAYAVEETPRGKLLLYVTGQPGVSLEQYVGRFIEFRGPATYDGELKRDYMSVTAVKLRR